MTASAFLAGAFPPAGKQIWNSDLLWIPIPIYSISPDKDDVSFNLKIKIIIKNIVSLRYSDFIH
jgi:hypothetical protein